MTTTQDELTAYLDKLGRDFRASKDKTQMSFIREQVDNLSDEHLTMLCDAADGTDRRSAKRNNFGHDDPRKSLAAQVISRRLLKLLVSPSMTAGVGASKRDFIKGPFKLLASPDGTYRLLFKQTICRDIMEGPIHLPLPEQFDDTQATQTIGKLAWDILNTAGNQPGIRQGW